MKKLYLLTVAMLFAGFTLASAQATLKPHGISPRQAEEDTTDIFEHAYSSLLNVGVGTVMYFEGSDTLALSGEAFSVASKPAESSADITETEELDEMTVVGMFVPDVEGQYVIQFDHNGSSATLTVNAGTFVTVDNCGLCHNTAKWDFKVDEWELTGHASMLQRGLDGTLSSHYSGSCISCHTTGFDLNAENDGFDDFGFIWPDSATLVSWGSPDGHLFEGAYDKAVETYPDAMARANIQCEACHGPGSGHNGNLLDSRMEASLDVNVCAVCHDEGSHHAFPDQWRHSGEDATEFDGRGFHGGHAVGAFVQSAGTRSGCSPCHSGAGYVEWVNEGRPVNSDGLPAATDILPEATNIGCAVCHDPHSTENEHQLRMADTQLGDGTPVTYEKYGTGTLCMHCHRSRREAKSYANDPDNASSHYGAHHGPEADLLLGVNAPDFRDNEGNPIEFPSSPHAVAVVPGEDHTNACVNCHMAGDLTDAEGNINHVGGHSWNMNDAEGNDHVEACAPCHGTIGESFKDKIYYVNGNGDLDGNGVTEGLQPEVKGLLEKLAELLPKNEDGDVELVRGDSTLTPAITRGAYVYFWIEEDRSFGMHNPAFTISLLKAAIEELDGVVSIGYPEQSGIPAKYAMSQNYPNPFNPTTRIDYSIVNNGHVNLTVYNALGQKVATLVNQEMSAGQHFVDFNASDLTSGIYFYRIQVTNGKGLQYQAINKMILMK